VSPIRVLVAGSRRRTFVGACVAMVTACSPDTKPAAMVRDSAGIRIVESRDTAAHLWTLEPVPAVDIGGDADDTLQALYEVGGATRLPDGRIVMTDGGTRQLRIYSASGEHLTAAGRLGEGPGEFRSVGRPFRFPPDSVLVHDNTLRRSTVFDGNGRFVREFRLQQPGSDAVSPVLLLDSTEILARPGFTFAANTPTGVYREEVPYLRFRMDGTFVDSVGRFPAAEMFVFSEGGNAFAGSLPFGRKPGIAATSDGFVFSSADRLEVARYDRGGRLLALFRVPDRVRPFTAEEKQRFRAAAVAGAEETERAFFERLFTVLPMPESLPACTGLIVDSSGRIWVRGFAWEDDETVRWTVFTPEGTLEAAVVMPARFEVQEIGADWVLGIWRDDPGVEHLRLHVLHRAG